MSVISCHRHGNTELAVEVVAGMEHKKAILVVLKHNGFLFKVLGNNQATGKYNDILCY